MSIHKDLTGKRFGRWTVIERVYGYQNDSMRPRVRYLCKCDCGTEKIVLAESISRGLSKSCGCLTKEVCSKSNRTHGESKTRLYRVWNAMKNRCYNKNTIHYEDYGGRGISVCKDWMESYESFRDWAICNGYKDGLSIDRINNDRNYEPENCRWIDCVGQANNRRSNRLYTYNGETHNIMEWSKIYGIPYKLLHGRLRSGWDIERALTEENHTQH